MVPIYFKGWLAMVRQMEEERRKQKHEEDITMFEGFGKSEEASSEAFEQWVDYVSWVLAGSPEENVNIPL